MDRETSVHAVVRALRKVNLEGSLFGQRVAIRFGLSESDVEALDMLIDMGAATAGRLGELMGLTSGAVTRLVDRLEQSGYVRRVPDPADRRRVIIEVVPDRIAAIRAMLDGVRKGETAELRRFSDTELQLIGDFLSRMAEVARVEAMKLHETSEAEDPTPPAENRAPLGALSRARLLFRSGASELILRGDPRLSELYRARFEGATPRVRVRDGVVSIQYRGLPFDWRKRKAELTLNGSIPWAIEIQGGASKLGGHLEGVDLRSFELSGGASRLDLTLSRPSGIVPIRVIGGTSTVSVRRPAGVAIRTTITGGVSRIEFDGEKYGARAGSSVVGTPGADTATDRYDVEVVGGSSKVVVAETR